VFVFTPILCLYKIKIINDIKIWIINHTKNIKNTKIRWYKQIKEKKNRYD